MGWRHRRPGFTRCVWRNAAQWWFCFGFLWFRNNLTSLLFFSCRLCPQDAPWPASPGLVGCLRLCVFSPCPPPLSPRPFWGSQGCVLVLTALLCREPRPPRALVCAAGFLPAPPVLARDLWARGLPGHLCWDLPLGLHTALPSPGNWRDGQPGALSFPFPPGEAGHPLSKTPKCPHFGFRL